MAEFRLDIGSEPDCQSCGAAIPLSAETCPGCSTQAPHRLTFEEFFVELERGRMLDARPGGLVIGRSGPDDDIPMYRHFGKGIFEVVGLMQGGEFIVSKVATEKHRAWLEEINQEKGECSGDLTLKFSPVTSTINTNLLPEWGGLWISYQFVVNGLRPQNGWMSLNGVTQQRTQIALPGNSPADALIGSQRATD